MKCNRSGSRFGFVRLRSDASAGVAVLKVDGLKLHGRFLHMNKAAFGRDALGSRLGMVAHPPAMYQVRKSRGQTGTWRDSKGDPEDHYGRERRRLHFVLHDSFTWGKEGGHREDGWGLRFSALKIDRTRRQVVFEHEDDFRIALSLGDSLWTSRGVRMTPWTEDMVMKQKREVWLRCSGVPLHARCPNTFLAIGQHWGDVWMVDFGSVESGSLDGGRINTLTDVAAPIFCGFSLVVDGKFFREVEDVLVAMA
ncbi:hypothetical protein Dimus_020456, partial [Dionaea muscipula]